MELMKWLYDFDTWSGRRESGCKAFVERGSKLLTLQVYHPKAAPSLWEGMIHNGQRALYVSKKFKTLKGIKNDIVDALSEVD